MNSYTINDDVTIRVESARPLLMNRYRIVRQLGQGGMGSVWLAEDILLDNKFFAVKMLPSILVSNKRAYSQLKKEALVSMKLTHPNIVTLRSFEHNDGNPFLLMDYIEGETLEDYLAEKEILTEEETINLLKPIAEALDYAHGEGVVHRDIKPANVIIRKDGHPFVLDFGIAREIQETMTRVTGKLSSGTLLYMSPEQLNGEYPKKEQDIYSFAAMVYECIKGNPPFYRGQIEYQILNNSPEPIGFEGSFSASFVLGVMAGLAKKPEDRPNTCAAILVERDVLPQSKQEASSTEFIPMEMEAGSTEFMPMEDVVPSSDAPHSLGSHISGHDGISRLFIEACKSFKYNVAARLIDEIDETDIDVQFCLGFMYANGRGVEKDDKEAVKWYRKSAEQGDAEAQFNLGFMYANGYGVENDDKEAVRWYCMSAEQGNARAQFNLGFMYANGRGTAKDDYKAVKWFSKSAEQGNARARFYLGFMYDNGRGGMRSRGTHPKNPLF